MCMNSAAMALKWVSLFHLGSVEPLGGGRRDPAVESEKWAGVTDTEQVGGAFPLHHQVSKDLVCTQSWKVGSGDNSTGHRREAGTGVKVG